MAVTFEKLKQDATIFGLLEKENLVWWQKCKNDPSLYIEIRKDNQVNIYFEGGSVARIHYCSKHKVLQVFTHYKYLGEDKSSTTYVECVNRLEQEIDSILNRIKGKYSQKKAVDGKLSKEQWSEKYIQGNLIVNNRDTHLDSEFAYIDDTQNLDIRIDLVRCVDGVIQFVELKRLDDGRMLKSTDENPEIITQMNNYRTFIKRYSYDILDYYQKLYGVKVKLGLPVPTIAPQSVDVEPYLLIFDRWEKAHSKREKHKERMEAILQKEHIKYAIINTL